MAENKEPRDEKLIEELYERLWWYTYEASEEEFDEKEVDAITRLLDVLEPVHDDRAYEPGADAALKRFWERYGEEEENASPDTDVSFSSETADEDGAEHRELDDGEESGGEDSAGMDSSSDAPMEDASEPEGEAAKAAAKPRSGRRGRWRKRLIRIAIGAAACVVLLISVNVGSYALRKKSFFEIVREEVGRTEITVTGNTEEFEEPADDAVECDSWEEAEEIVEEDILEPSFLPDDYELKSLIIEKLDSIDYIIGYYENREGDYLEFRVNIYEDTFKKYVIQYDEDWIMLDEYSIKNNAQFYSNGNIYGALFTEGKCVYHILSSAGIDILKKVVDQMS